MLILLSLLYQSCMSSPLLLVTTFKVGAYLINGSFSWVEFTQLLGAALGSTVELNPQCCHPVETKGSMRTTIKEMLSTQNEQKFLDWQIFFMCLWMDQAMILPSPNFGVFDIINQEHSAI